MLRYLLFGILITAAIIGGQLYLNQQAPQETAKPEMTQPTQTVPSTSVATSQPPQPKITPASHDPDAADTPPNADSAAASANALEFGSDEPTYSPWQDDESQPVTPPRYVNRGMDARPLTMNKTDIAKLSVGDQIKLPVPQTARDYEMTVQQIGRHRNGDKSLKGSLVANPSYTVVMTEGSTSTFATINTPDGSFLLEASGNQGWMVSMNDMDAMIDPNIRDYKIPDIDRDNPDREETDPTNGGE